MHSIIRFLGICDNEWPRLLSMGVLIFLLMVGWAFGNSAGDSFFVKAAGPANLPYAYILKAAFEILVAAFYFRVVDRMLRHRFFVIILTGTGAILFLIRLLIPLDYLWIPFAVFVITDVVTTLVFMHYWTFANEVFDPREGKRVFPILGGVGLGGAVIGGAATQFIVTATGTINMFAIWAAILIIAIPFLLRASKAARSIGLASSRQIEPADETGGFLERVSKVWDVPIVRTLAFISIPLCWIYYLFDFQFYFTLNEIYQDQDMLTGFLGIFNGIVSLSGLALQFFFSGRILQQIGVGSAIMIHPVSVTIGSAALLVQGLAAAVHPLKILSVRGLTAVFAKFTDVAISYSIGESATNLLYNSIPGNKRGQSRAFINGTIEPIGTVSGSGILIILSIMSVSLFSISLLALGLGFVWIFLARKLKSDYIRSLVDNLSSLDIDLRSRAIRELSNLHDSTTSGMLLKAIVSPDEEVALYALERLKMQKEDKIIPELCILLPRVSPRVAIPLLDTLSDMNARPAIEAILPFLTHDEPSLRAHAVKALSKLNGDSDPAILESMLDDEAIQVRVEALMALIRKNPNLESNTRPVKLLRTMAEIDAGPPLRANAAYIIGEGRVNQLFELLPMLAETPEPETRLEAIRSLGKTGEGRFIPFLARCLPDPVVSDAASEAIAALGMNGIVQLHKEVLEKIHGDPALAALLKSIGKIGNPQSIPILQRFLRSGPAAVRQAAIEALAAIQEANCTPDGSTDRFFSDETQTEIKIYFRKAVEKIARYRNYAEALRESPDRKAVTLLLDALEYSTRLLIAEAFRTMELFTEQKTVKTASANLRSRDRRIRAEALELLEESSPEARALVGILESYETGFYRRNIELPPTVAFVLKNLINDSYDSWIRVCAIFASGRLKDSALISCLTPLCSDPDLLARYNAILALRNMGENITDNFEEAETMASKMELILFLRSVPLFADLTGIDLEWISDIVKERRYPAGHLIFRENDEGDALYIIVSGSVRVVKGGEKTVTLAILQDRDCFGEMAVLDNEPRSASAEVKAEATLLVITREEFQRLLLARPQMAFSLFKGLSKRLREVNSKLLEDHRN